MASEPGVEHRSANELLYCCTDAHPETAAIPRSHHTQPYQTWGMGMPPTAHGDRRKGTYLTHQSPPEPASRRTSNVAFKKTKRRLGAQEHAPTLEPAGPTPRKNNPNRLVPQGRAIARNNGRPALSSLSRTIFIPKVLPKRHIITESRISALDGCSAPPENGISQLTLLSLHLTDVAFS